MSIFIWKILYRIMGINIIVAFTTKGFGIGNDNKIPWNIKEDLKHFQEITIGSTIVMGRKTWESLPKRPLKNRKNVVLSSNENVDGADVCVKSFEELDELIKFEENVFIIGGESLYRYYLKVSDNVYATLIEKDVAYDKRFPIDHMDMFYISDFSTMNYSDEEKCNYRYIKYTRKATQHGEHQYLNLVRDIIENGQTRSDRTGVGTKSVFARQIRFDISKSIPILTTKFVPFKLTIKELLFFLRGETDSKILEVQGVNIWRDNTTREFLDKRGLSQYTEGTLGPMYGFVWRHFGADYEGSHVNYSNKGIDQIANLIEGLKKDPYSRRHLLTTYCPSYNDQGVLIPCHGIVVQFHVEEQNQLSCHMYQRSMDTALGCPINIASYSILTHIIAKLCDLKPKELVISTGDTHVYLTHIEPLKEQLRRSLLPFPILNMNIDKKSIDELDQSDFELVGYLHHPTIKMSMAV
jgi:dihydrofolate reductase/thymidylate synthase